MCGDPSARTLQMCKMDFDPSAWTLQICKMDFDPSARILHVCETDFRPLKLILQVLQFRPLNCVLHVFRGVRRQNSWSTSSERPTEKVVPVVAGVLL